MPSTSASQPPPQLDLDAVERRTIETFKRSGAFDAIRKDTLRTWTASPQAAVFRDRLKQVVVDEVARDAGLLARERGKAATLVAGAVERTQLYQDTRKRAAEDIFNKEAYRDTIYQAIKKVMDEASKGRAQEAAKAFIEREET